ncbi:MAG: hypothetical protein ACLT76_05675 [Clostridium fessum]
MTDEGEGFGTVKDILQTAANDVYVDRSDLEGKEYLFPSIKECILNVDLEAGTSGGSYHGRSAGSVNGMKIL